MKCVLSLLAVLSLLVSLAACGSGVSSPSGPSSSGAGFSPSSLESAVPTLSGGIPDTPSDTPSPEPSAPSMGLYVKDPETFQRVPYVDPNEYNMAVYDTSAILAAWEAKDPAGLSDCDRAIYGAAVQVLESILTPGMEEPEKEYAVYLWVTGQIQYDWRHLDPLESAGQSSFTPYGGLVERKAVCLGFASSFQLLMDMAGVECITVVGAAAGSSRDHAWNMVRLDGAWYCVDPTWDSNFRSWRYFNVTSDFMAFNDHQWDYDSIPEATAQWNPDSIPGASAADGEPPASPVPTP